MRSESDHQGCQEPQCGETQGLEITKEFRQCYENRMRRIEEMGGGDAAQEKINLQQSWIRDLTEQNEMLVKVVEQLELDVTDRVQMLEKKLINSAQAGQQRVKTLQSDLDNLLEFIRRARTEGVFDAEGLKFYHVAYSDLCDGERLESVDSSGQIYQPTSRFENAKLQERLRESENKIRELELENENFARKESQMSRELGEKEKLIKELVERNGFLNKHGADVGDIFSELKNREKNLEDMRQSMVDMRSALTAEVAEKHDVVVLLRRNLQHLEEQCRQADKQTHFKDDIIKELRKEIKQLKKELQNEKASYEEAAQNLNSRIEQLNGDNAELNRKLQRLTDENARLKQDLRKAKETLEELEKTTEEYIMENEDYKNKHRQSLSTIEELRHNLDRTKSEADKQKREHRNSISTLEEEKIRYINELENVRRESKGAFDELQEAMFKDLESYEKMATDKQKHIDSLQMELDYEKKRHRKSMDAVVELNNETRNQVAKIESLEQTLKELKKKPDTHTVGLDTAALNPKKETVAVDTAFLEPRKKTVSTDAVVVEDFFVKEDARRGAHGQLQSGKPRSKPMRTDEGQELEDVIEDLQGNVSKLVSRQGGRNTKTTIADLESQLETCLREKEARIEEERNKRAAEVANFKETIRELENALNNTQGRSDNLQRAECVCALKAELEKARAEKVQYENIIKYLKGEMRMLADQLGSLQMLLNTSNANTVKENTELKERLNEYEITSENLLAKLTQLQQQLMREVKINEVQVARIEELQQTIAQKNMEINSWNVAYTDAKNKLEAAAVQNQELQATIVDLQGRLQDYEEQQMMCEERSQNCRKEITVCRENLSGLKEKMNSMKHLLGKKTDECNQLRYELEKQKHLADNLNSECQCSRAQMEDQAANLNNTISLLDEKVKKTEHNNRLLNEEIKAGQAKLIEAAEREAEQQRCFSDRERVLTESLHMSQKEEVRLVDLVEQLERSCDSLKEELRTKEEQLETVRANFHQLKSGKQCQLAMAQEEVTTLRDELNKTIQLQNKLKAENEKLRDQIKDLQLTISTHEERNHLISQQLDQCLSEIQTVQSDKDVAEQANEELRNELQSLQNAFSNLNREYRNKTESMINLEMELVDSKSNQEQLCEESRRVVNNVRAWLQEQQKINSKLTAKLKAKNAIIQKMRTEKEKLYKKHTCNCNINTSWGGYTSNDSASPISAISSAQEEWRTYSDTEDGEEVPQVWIHRVDSMTEQVRRNNQYWQEKVNENDYTVTRDE